MDEHRTEVDGWVAVWQLHRDEIRMTLVRNTAESKPLVSCALASAPDLVQMRDRFPKLARLWDAVHAQFWHQYRPHGNRSVRDQR